MQRRPTFFKAHSLRPRKSVDLDKPSSASTIKEGLPAITPGGAHSSAARSSSGDLRTPTSSGSSQTDAARSLSSHGIVSPRGDLGKLGTSPPPSPPAAPGSKGGRNEGSSRWPWKRSRGGAARARAGPSAGLYAHDLGEGGEDRRRGVSEPAPFFDGGTFGAGQLIDDEELLMTERGRGEGNGLSDDDDLDEPTAYERGSIHFGCYRHRVRRASPGGRGGAGQHSSPARGFSTEVISETSEEADEASLEVDDEVRPVRAATAPATMGVSATEDRPEASREGEREPREEREPERDKGEPEEQSWWSARVAAWQRNSDDDTGSGGEGTGGGFFAQALSALAAATSSDSPLPPEAPRCPGSDRGGGGEGGLGKAGKEEQNSGASCGEGVGKGGGRDEALRRKAVGRDGGSKPPRGSRCLLLDSPFFCKANGTEQMGFVLRNEDLRTGFKQVGWLLAACCSLPVLFLNFACLFFSLCLVCTCFFFFGFRPLSLSWAGKVSVFFLLAEMAALCLGRGSRPPTVPALDIVVRSLLEWYIPWERFTPTEYREVFDW